MKTRCIPFGILLWKRWRRRNSDLWFTISEAEIDLRYGMVIDWHIPAIAGHYNIIYNMHTHHTRYHLQGQVVRVNNDIYKLDSKFLPITHHHSPNTWGKEQI